MLPTVDKLISIIGLKSNDCHPQLPRDKDYKALGFGAGAICFEELMFICGVIHIHKPDIIIELGTSWGASALGMGAVLKDIGKGKLLTVDKATTPPNTEKYALELDLPIEYITSTMSTDFLRTYQVDDSLRYLVFSDTDIPIRPTEVDMVRRGFPRGTIILVHDTSDLHPVGPMHLKKSFPNEDIVELPSPRGLSILKV